MIQAAAHVPVNKGLKVKKTNQESIWGRKLSKYYEKKIFQLSILFFRP